MMHPIQPTGQWRQLRGAAHGLQQPTLIGTISISRLSGASLQEFESGLIGLIDEPLPAARPGMPESERLADLFAF
ncbi:MAG: hypothetical protein Q7S90_05470, partial [Rubrivivax sp.]|nr:hypothetical protein [Rubrivivax sp.]